MEVGCRWERGGVWRLDVDGGGEGVEVDVDGGGEGCGGRL